MTRRAWPTSFALWAAVGALLLKSAVPLLAAGAAQMRGVTVADVCPLYGVAMPGAAGSGHAGHAHHHPAPAGHDEHGSHSTDAHTGDHCALTALAALALPDLAAPGVTPAPSAAPERRSGATCAARRDACATWAAQLEHGPPARA